MGRGLEPLSPLAYSTEVRLRRTKAGRGPSFSRPRAKRRRKDLNLRGPFGPSGFQDRCLQPLSHASALYGASWCLIYPAPCSALVRGPFGAPFHFLVRGKPAPYLSASGGNHSANPPLLYGASKKKEFLFTP